jgi:hypothetical protein
MKINKIDDLEYKKDLKPIVLNNVERKIEEKEIPISPEKELHLLELKKEKNIIVEF